MWRVLGDAGGRWVEGGVPAAASSETMAKMFRDPRAANPDRHKVGGSGPEAHPGLSSTVSGTACEQKRHVQSIEWCGMWPGTATEVHWMEYMRLVGVCESTGECGGAVGQVALAYILAWDVHPSATFPDTNSELR